MPICIGTMVVAMVMNSSTFRPRKRSLAKANPASVPKATVPSATHPETMVELSSAVPMFTLVSAAWKFFTRLDPGIRFGGTLLISVFDVDAATIVQKNGKIERRKTRDKTEYVSQPAAR